MGTSLLKPKLILMALVILVSPAFGATKTERLTEQISVFQSDPAIVQFLVEEAVRARVRSIKPMRPVGKYPDGRPKYGAYGRTTSSKQIYLHPTRPGGRSVVNITHEIAHAAAFGGRCGGHNKRWLKNYLEIAKRFETRFPAVRWSGVKPTQRVLRNVERYGIGTKC